MRDHPVQAAVRWGIARMLAISITAALLAGCSLLPPPAGIQLTIPVTADVAALPVTVVDHAGIVGGAAPGAPANDAPFETTVRAVPGRDDAVAVHWIGGACDDRTIITIDPDADRYRVTIETQSSATGCNASGIFRTVVLTLAEPVVADAFEVR